MFVSMIFDSDKCVLRYEVNGVDQGVAFTKEEIQKTCIKLPFLQGIKGIS